jgi:hypothetical protein
MAMATRRRSPVLATLGVLAVVLLAGAARAQEADGTDATIETPDPRVTVRINVVGDDDNDTPVGGARVLVFWGDGDDERRRRTTDSKGRAEFDSLPAVAVTLQVIAAHFETFGKSYDLADADEEVALTVTLKSERPPDQ